MLKNGQIYFENIVAVWTPQDFNGVFRHFSILWMKRLILEFQQYKYPHLIFSSNFCFFFSLNTWFNSSLSNFESLVKYSFILLSFRNSSFHFCFKASASAVTTQLFLSSLTSSTSSVYSWADKITLFLWILRFSLKSIDLSFGKLFDVIISGGGYGGVSGLPLSPSYVSNEFWIHDSTCFDLFTVLLRYTGFEALYELLFDVTEAQRTAWSGISGFPWLLYTSVRGCGESGGTADNDKTDKRTKTKTVPNKFSNSKCNLAYIKLTEYSRFKENYVI